MASEREALKNIRLAASCAVAEGSLHADACRKGGCVGSCVHERTRKALATVDALSSPPATDAGEGREALVKRLREAAHEAVGFALSEALSGNAIAVSLIAENTRRLLDAAEKGEAT